MPIVPSWRSKNSLEKLKTYTINRNNCYKNFKILLSLVAFHKECKSIQNLYFVTFAFCNKGKSKVGSPWKSTFIKKLFNNKLSYMAVEQFDYIDKFRNTLLINMINRLHIQGPNLTIHWEMREVDRRQTYRKSGLF